jgi:hypothetical protein
MLLKRIAFIVGAVSQSFLSYGSDRPIWRVLLPPRFLDFGTTALGSRVSGNRPSSATVIAKLFIEMVDNENREHGP